MYTIEILENKKFNSFYTQLRDQQRVEINDIFSENDFLNEFELTLEHIRSCLSERWIEDCCGEADFAVGDGWGLVWQQCGGIYSERICCPQYINAIIKALEMSKYKDKWIYHTVYELPDVYANYEFITYKRTVYFPESSKVIASKFQFH